MEKMKFLNSFSISAMDANAESLIASACSTDWLDVRSFILITMPFVFLAIFEAKWGHFNTRGNQILKSKIIRIPWYSFIYYEEGNYNNAFSELEKDQRRFS